MFGSEITTGTGGSVGAMTACCGAAALVVITAAAAATRSTHFGLYVDECALDGLWFYYDEDDQLQCVCLDNEDVADDWLSVGVM
jgi:hypothetical protein